MEREVNMKISLRRREKLKFLLSLLFLSLLCLPTRADERQAPTTYNEKQFKAVIREYKAIIKKNPVDENAHLGLIQSYKTIGESKDAINAVKQALERLPASVPLYIASGDLYFQEANMDEAAKSYQKAVQLDAKNARGYFGLFKVNMFNFNRKTAWEMIQRANELDSRDQEIAVTYNRHLPMVSRLRLHEKYPGVWRMANPPERAEIQLKTVTGLPRSVRLLVRETKEEQTFNESGGVQHRITPVSNYSVDVTVTPDGMIVYNPADPLFQPEVTHIITVPNFDTVVAASNRFINRMMTTLYTIQAVITGTDGPRKMTLEVRDALEINGIVLRRKFADEVNLEIAGESSNFVIARNLQIGPLEFEDCLMEVENWNPGIEVDGTIGLDFFERYLVTADLPNSVLRLNPLPLINGQPFDDPDSWNIIDRSRPAELESFLPLGKINRHVVVQGNLNKKIQGYFNLRAQMDQTCVNHKNWKNLKSVNVGTFRTIIDRPCYVPQMRPVQPDVFEVVDRLGTLDFNVLKDYAITIDYRDGLIDFAKVKK